MRQTARLLVALTTVFVATVATAQPSRVTSYFGGSSQQVGVDTPLTKVAASAAFEIQSAFDGPALITCSIAWPENSVRRRYRGAGSIALTCADGSVLETPPLDFRSGGRGERHLASFHLLFLDLSNCSLPIRALGTVQLRGRELGRFLPSGVLPRTGLRLDLVCEAL